VRTHLEGLLGKACLQILDAELHLHELTIELLEERPYFMRFKYAISKRSFSSSSFWELAALRRLRACCCARE